jgi:hypothetical protein
VATRAASELEPTSDGADARVSLGVPSAAQHNCHVPAPNFRHRAEGDDTPPPREETATADDDLVRVVNVPLVADVIQPADVRAVAREHAIASGDGEEPAEVGLCSVVAPLAPATLLHGVKGSDGSGRLLSGHCPRAPLQIWVGSS